MMRLAPWRLVAFFALLLIVRGVPALVLYRRDGALSVACFPSLAVALEARARRAERAQ